MCSTNRAVIIVWTKFVFDAINGREHNELRVLNIATSSLINATYLEVKHKNRFV